MHTITIGNKRNEEQRSRITHVHPQTSTNQKHAHRNWRNCRIVAMHAHKEKTQHRTFSGARKFKAEVYRNPKMFNEQCKHECNLMFIMCLMM